jgi:sugar lactone lactonase YvrE
MVSASGVSKYYLNAGLTAFSAASWDSYPSPAIPYKVGPSVLLTNCGQYTASDLNGARQKCWSPTLFYLYGQDITNATTDTGHGLYVKRVDTLWNGKKVYIAYDTSQTRTRLLSETGESKWVSGVDSGFLTTQAAWTSYTIATNPYFLGPRSLATLCAGVSPPVADRKITLACAPSKRYSIVVAPGQEVYVSRISATSAGETVYLAEDVTAGGIIYTRMVTSSGSSKFYMGPIGLYTGNSWNTYSTPTPAYTLNYCLGTFDPAEFLLRLQLDSTLRLQLGISSIEASTYENVTNTIRFVTRTPTALNFYAFSTASITSTSVDITLDFSTNLSIPVIRGIYKWKSQYYILTPTTLVRLNALSRLEILAGKSGQTQATPYKSADYGYNMAFSNLSDMCFDPNEEAFFFTDTTQNQIYKLANDGLVYPLCTRTPPVNIATLYEDGETSSAAVDIYSPFGITIGPDSTLYVTSSTFNQVYAMKKAYMPNGDPYYKITVLAGLLTVPGTIRTGETAKYSKPWQPRHIRYGSDGKLYFLNTRVNGTTGIAKLTLEEYVTYYKGSTGAIQYAPIQVIGNNTTEGNILTTSATTNAISTEFFAMHATTDEEGNVYFADPKVGNVYKMDLNNQMTTLCYIEKAFTVTLHANSTLYVGTEDSNDSKLYMVPLANPSNFTQIPGMFGSIRCMTVKQNGILFLGVNRSSQSLILYKNVVYDTLAYSVYFTTTSVNQYVKAKMFIPTSADSNFVFNLLKTTYNRTLYFMKDSIHYRMIYYPAGVYGSGYPELLQFDICVNSTWKSVDINTFPDSTPVSIYIQNDLPLATLTGLPNALCLDTNDTLYATTLDKKLIKLPLVESVQTVTSGGQSVVAIGSVSGTPTTLIDSSSSAFSQSNLFGVSYSPSENSLYITTYDPSARVHRYALTTNTLVPFMGLQRTGYPIHGSTLANATLQSPAGICRDTKGNLFVLDCQNRTDAVNRTSILLKVPSKFFFIQDYVYPLIGTGIQATAPEEGLALTSKFGAIRGIASDFYGNVYFTTALHTVHKYDALTETVTTIAGNGVAGFSGDGGLAQNATLNSPSFLQITTSQTIYVFDSGNNRIRRITLLGNGSYVINTFATTTGVLGGMAVDIYENVIYTNKTTKQIVIINQRGLSTTLSPNVSLAGIVSYGQYLYYLNTDDNKIYWYTYPYTTPIVYTATALLNPSGAITVDSAGSIYYITTQNEIRKVTTAVDSSYIGVAGTQSFFDGVVSTAGIKDNQYRLSTPLNGPQAITVDIFSRILFSDDQGTRIRCSPTGIQLNECYVTARYILFEASSPGKKFSFSQIAITTTSTTISKSITTPMNTFIFDLDNSVNINYINCKSSTPDSIGTKVYLLNENRDIVSIRLLTNTCVSTGGETLVYAVPWANSCSFADYVSIAKNCGVTGVRGIIITNPTNTSIMNYFTEIRIVSRRYDTAAKQFFLDLDVARASPIQFQDSKEILGIFMMRALMMDSSQTAGTLIQVYTNTSMQGVPQIEKKIVVPTIENTRFEFVDFRSVVADFGCSSLDSIYSVGIGFNRIRYIRILMPQGLSQFQIGEVVAISAETGKNTALGRPAYTPSSTSTAIWNITNGVTNKPSGFLTTGESWVEVDLGVAVPLESIFIYPPTNTYFAYPVECYSELRNRVPIPSIDANPWDTRVARIRVQNSGYTDAVLQSGGLKVQALGGSSYSNPNGTFTASSYLFSWMNASSLFTQGVYYSSGTTQNEFFEIALTSPQVLTGVQFLNRSDCCQKRQYGSQILLYNAAGYLLQRNCIMGLNTGDKTETFPVALPTAIQYHFPSNKKGVANVRYVRYSNTILTTGKIQIAQLAVYDTNGTNVALNKTATSLSIEPGTTLTAPVNGRLMPSAANMYRSFSSGATEYYEIDLGTNFEIDSVVYYNSTSNPSWSTGARIELRDSNGATLYSRLLQGTLQRESFDFRPEAQTAVRARYVRFEAPGFLNTGIDPVIDPTSVTFANSATAPFKLSNLRVRDIYNRNVAIGKLVKAYNITATGASLNTDASIYAPTNGSADFYTTSEYPGSYWEVDLGQEYSLLTVEFTPDPTFGDKYRNVPLTLFDDEHVPIKTLCLNGLKVQGKDYTIDLTTLPYYSGSAQLENLNTAVRYQPQTTLGIGKARFIHIDGSSTGYLSLLQVVVLDTNGMNVALGKSTKATNGAANSYLAVNGLGLTAYVSNVAGAYWEVDLGGIYNIAAIHLYGAQNVSAIYALGEQRDTAVQPVWSRSNVGITTLVPKRVFPESAISCITPMVGIGRKARYVRLFKDAQTQQGLLLSQIVITDSFGRNIAFRKAVNVNARQTVNTGNNPAVLVDGVYESRDSIFYMTDGAYFANNISYTYVNELYIDIDLGDEYWITDITIYVSKVFLGFGTWARNILVEFRDTYQNKVGAPFTTSARIDDFTLKIRTQSQGNYCPANSTFDGTNCVTACLATETDFNGRCYAPCDTTLGQYAQESIDKTKCYSCPTYRERVWGPNLKCRDKCENNPTIGDMMTYDDNNCVEKCPAQDADGAPNKEFGSYCQTDSYTPTNPLLAVINNSIKLFDAFINMDLQALQFRQLAFSWPPSYGISDVTFDGLKSEDIARRIYRFNKTPEPKQTWDPIATTRSSYAKGVVNKTSLPPGTQVDTVTYPAGFTVTHERIYDWSLNTTDPYFRRDTTNPAFVIGRYLAETINLTGTATQVSVSVQTTLPAASALQCPAGYSPNPAATNDSNRCVTTQPPNSDILAGSYYLQCPAGFSVHPTDRTSCIQDCPSGFTIKNTNTANPDFNKCVYRCPDGYTEFEGNANKCATDCTRQTDSAGKPMMTNPWVANDTNDYMRCITQKPSYYTNYQYARIYMSGPSGNWFDSARTSYYAWVSEAWEGFTSYRKIQQPNNNSYWVTIPNNTFLDWYSNCQMMISGYNYTKDCGNTVLTRFNITVDPLLMENNTYTSVYSDGTQIKHSQLFNAQFTTDRFRRLYYGNRTLFDKPSGWSNFDRIYGARSKIQIDFTANVN